MNSLYLQLSKGQECLVLETRLGGLTILKN